MNIQPYNLATTNDQLTSRCGLVTIAELIQTMQLAQRIDQHFPAPKSNRGFAASVYIQTLILMQHEGSFHLDDVRHLNEDSALRSVLGLGTIPQAVSIGAWLRRQGLTSEATTAMETANKANMQWTYNKNKGCMPMVGHIAETGQVVACDFRQGNVSPAKQNLEFIQQCQRALPSGCNVGALRIDAAGYQTSIIQYCDQQNIDYAIRAKMSPSIKRHISALNEDQWVPLIKRNGEASTQQGIYTMPHCIGDYEQAFDLVIMRQPMRQSTFDFGDEADSESHCVQGYIYRAIATNRLAELTASAVVHWYNQRAEDSENRIKELKLDFGGGTLPCSDFAANALYFRITALSYNLLALMRQLLPEDLAAHRVTTIRWRLYGMAAKVVRSGRQVWIKLRDSHRNLLAQVLLAVRMLDPTPMCPQKHTKKNK